MNMKYIITESQYKRVVKEDNDERISRILDRVNTGISKIPHSGWDDYGLEDDKEMLNGFKRGFGRLKEILARNIHSIENGEFDWYIEMPKFMFIEQVLVDTLLDFFDYLSDGELDLAGADVKRKGIHEMWLYFIKDLYGDLLGQVYDEIKNK